MKTTARSPVHEWNDEPNRQFPQTDPLWQSVVPDSDEGPLTVPPEDAPIEDPVPDQPQQP